MITVVPDFWLRLAIAVVASSKEERLEWGLELVCTEGFGEKKRERERKRVIYVGLFGYF